ncbi:MAG: hypothetical protein WAL30_00675 [Candidatus Aquirickettsiella sp.]
MDENIESMYVTGKIHTVHAWINFALSMAKESEEPTENIVKKAFEEQYKPTAGYTTYSDKSRIPNFDELLDRQKAAWLTAGQAAFHAKKLETGLSNVQLKF